MKKSMLILVATLALIACNRQNSEDTVSDAWNGYQDYLKTGEIIHTLWAGKNTNIGTVTYGLDDNANFYVTYDCSSSGWMISETHMYSGDKATMPLNKPGAPKIGLFPYSRQHNPRVSTYTYRVPLVMLPPCAAPGFVVSSHCVVRSPSGRSETAWAEGDYTFSDKGWGWYDDYFYDPPVPTFPVLYGITGTNNLLRLYHLDITNNSQELMLEEYVGNAPGTYNSAAYDLESGMLFFTKDNSSEIWINELQSENPSFPAGSITGSAASGTFYNGHYYYINSQVNSINQVSFTDSWGVYQVNVLDTIPGQIIINDIAMQPDGEKLFIMGQYNGFPGLITWDPDERVFYSTPVSVDQGSQIAFGSDGLLYAIGQNTTEDSCSYIYLLDFQCDTMTVILDDVIFIDDPFTDLSGGPGL